MEWVVQKFTQLLDEIITINITDLHITSGDCPFIRTPKRDVEPITQFGSLTEADVIELIIFTHGSITPEKIQEAKKGINYIYEHKWTRFRANASHNKDGIAIALRTIKKNIPTAESVGLTDDILHLLQKDRGLILITGGTGSGKTTSMVAMIDYLNKYHHKHIITVEDPIEYLFQNNQSLIHQKQVWKHVETFDQAIRDAMREDPDILMVWEMRDMETISAVLTLAETGHLVLSTLHTNDVVQTFDRLVYAFPAQMQSQIRVQLALILVAVIGQIILPKLDGTGNVVAREVFINNDATRNIIIEWNINHLYSVMEIGQNDGMVLMDHRLIEMYEQKQIGHATMIRHIKDPHIMKQYLNPTPSTSA